MANKGKIEKRTTLDVAVKAVKTKDSTPYEFMVVLKPLLPEDVRIKTLDSISKLITDAGGTIEQKEVWGKKHLAYKIKGHEEGYYIIYSVVIPRSELTEVERNLNLIGDVLRFIFIKESEL